MRTEGVTIEDLEAFWERLRGPLGGALRTAGEIMEQRLRARGQDISELSEMAVLDLLSSALRVAIPSHYNRVDRALLDETLDRMDEAFAEARMYAASNAVSTETMN